jgi:hypothetical protein
MAEGLLDGQQRWRVDSIRLGDILYLRQFDFSQDGKGFAKRSSVLWWDPQDGDDVSDI